MFRSLARIPVKSTGDPIRDSELDKARLEATPSLVETLPTLAICAFVLALLFYPHAMVIAAGKILNSLAAIAGALGAVVD